MQLLGMSLNGGLGTCSGPQKCLVRPCFLRELFANLKYQGSTHQTLAALDRCLSCVAWGGGPPGCLGSGTGSSLTSPAVPSGQGLPGPRGQAEQALGFPLLVGGFFSMLPKGQGPGLLWLHFPAKPLPGGLDE